MARCKGSACVPEATYNLHIILRFELELPRAPREDIARGKFDRLLNWATTNLYQHGRKFTVDELVRRVTGDGIQWQPYVAYLEAKFKEIY
jgi:carboxypeptidase Taq